MFLIRSLEEDDLELLGVSVSKICSSLQVIPAGLSWGLSLSDITEITTMVFVIGKVSSSWQVLPCILLKVLDLEGVGKAGESTCDTIGQGGIFWIDCVGDCTSDLSCCSNSRGNLAWVCSSPWSGFLKSTFETTEREKVLKSYIHTCTKVLCNDTVLTKLIVVGVSLVGNSDLSASCGANRVGALSVRAHLFSFLKFLK